MSASSRRLIAALALSLCAALATTQVGVASAAGAPRPAMSTPAKAAPSDLVALDAGPIGPIDHPPIGEVHSSNDPGDSADGSAFTDSGGGGGSGGGTSGAGGGNYAWVLYVGGGVLAFIAIAGWVGGRNE